MRKRSGMLQQLLNDYRIHLGNWSSWTPELIKFNTGKKELLRRFAVKVFYKVAVVLQPPFVFKNKTSG